MATPTRRTVRRMHPPADYDEDPIDPKTGLTPNQAPSRRPRRRVEETAESGGGEIHGGWTEGQKQMDAASPFAQALKLDDNAQMIKFLDDVPYANFRRHWVDRSSPQGGTTRRPFTCLLSLDKECPLCEIGDRSQAVSAFNVVVLGDDGQILHKTWDVGARLFQVLKAFANDPKIGPLTKHYFLVSHTGKKQNAQTNVIPVKTTALSEDYDMDPIESDELEKVKRYTPEVIEVPSHKTLSEIAAEIADDYE